MPVGDWHGDRSVETVGKQKTDALTCVQVDGPGLSAVLGSRSLQSGIDGRSFRRDLRRRYRGAYTAGLGGVFLVLFFFVGPHVLWLWLLSMIVLPLFAMIRAHVVYRALMRAAAEGNVDWLQPRRWKKRWLSGADGNGKVVVAAAAPYSLAMADDGGRVAVIRRKGSAWVLGAGLLKDWYGLTYPEIRHLFPDPNQRFAVARLMGPDAMVALVADNLETTTVRLGAIQFLKAPPPEWKRWYKQSKARNQLQRTLGIIDDPRVLETVFRWVRWDPAAAVEPLVRAIGLADSGLGQIAGWFLARSKHPDAEAQALPLLEDQRPEVLVPTVEALAEIGGDNAFEALAELKRHSPDPGVQRAVNQTLGSLRQRTSNSTFDGRLALVADHGPEGQLSMSEGEGGLQFAEEVAEGGLQFVDSQAERSELVAEPEAERVVEPQAEQVVEVD